MTLGAGEEMIRMGYYRRSPSAESDLIEQGISLTLGLQNLPSCADPTNEHPLYARAE